MKDMELDIYAVSEEEIGLKEMRQSSNEIKLTDILRDLWSKKTFILSVSVVFFILGLLIAVKLPVVYNASCNVILQTNQRGQKQLGGLIANVPGINLNTSLNAETLPTNLYPEIIQSVPFCLEIMQVSVSTPKTMGKDITLFEYYTKDEYKQTNPIAILKKYTIGLPNVITGFFKKKNKSLPMASKTFSDSLNQRMIIKLSTQERTVISAIQNSVIYESDSRGYITLGYTFPEALGAAQITEKIRTLLTAYVIKYKVQKEQENLAFVEQSYQEARKDFLEKQTNLASFQDANRGLITATGRTIETRLRSEYDVAFTIYNELAKQREQAQLAVKESTPVFTVINPVIVPSSPSGTSRPLITFVFLLLGTILSSIYIIIRMIIIRLIIQIKEEEKDFT